MSSPAQLTKRVEDLEVTEKPQEPSVIVCEPDEVDTLKAKYPNIILIVDDIPRSES
ncbi:MAG TPA: hypothetical protein VKL21_07720 [Candidatus Methanoperedens sp.]|jgi:hypothetical protein|nr:hypothetical protein [Candidatus Methanoperedens sp.]